MVSWKDNCNVSILYPTSSNATTRTQERKKRTARTTYWRQMGHSASCLAQLVQAAMCPHSSSTHSSGAAMQILQHSSAGSLSTSATRATSLPATTLLPRGPRRRILTVAVLCVVPPQGLGALQQVLPLEAAPVLHAITHQQFLQLLHVQHV